MYQAQVGAGNHVRTQARLEHHFDVERELAKRLRNAGKESRRSLYTAVYDELFSRVLDHPQFLAIRNPEKRERRIRWQMRYLLSRLKGEKRFAEIGPGDCALSMAMCDHATSVVGVDVSNEITRRDDLPANFSLVISDGSSVPLAAGSIDLVYSDQLMEHLHPEDAATQLDAIFNSLRPGGCYFMVTPSSAIGPHDITKFFDFDTPLGLHLKEYNYAELGDLLKRAGFEKCYALIGMAGRYLHVPMPLASGVEALFLKLPRGLRRKAIKNRIARPVLNLLLGARVLAIKPG